MSNNNLSPHDQSRELARKNARMALGVFVVVVLMVGLSFASVPLYNMFCRVTGWGGTTQTAESLPSEDEIIDRVITVRFDANTAPNLPWTFKSEKLSVDVKIGARGFINYIAENKSDKPVTGTALFNVTPVKAGKYFHKVQCFCFDEQTLQPNQQINMPVMFYVDPKLHTDKNMSDVSTITLSYSFFRAETSELDTALEAFYNDEPLLK